MSEAGDGPVLPVHLRGLWDILSGGQVRAGQIASFPPGLQSVAAAMAAANGAGRLAALEQFAPELVPFVLAEGGEHEEAGPPPYPVEALPPVLRQLVVEAAAATRTPPELAALPALAVCAGVLGNTAYLHMKETWQEYASVWFAVVAVAGSGKTPAMKAAQRPLDVLVSAARDRYEDERKQYKLALAAYEGTPKSQRHGGSPEEPVETRYLAVDATLEALKRVLVVNPGVVMLFDELSSWVRGFDAYRAGGRGADRSNWLSLWSGGMISVDRASQEYLYHRTPVVALCGGIQPARLSDLADEAKASDGFLERILWAYPHTEPVHLSDDDVRPETVRAVTAMLRDLRHRVTAGTACIVLDQRARRAFAAWHAANVVQMWRVTGILQSVYAKLPGQLLKLALVLHCVTHPADPGGRPVTAEVIEDAILLVDYHRAHAHRALAAIGGASKATADVERQPSPDADALRAERLYLALRRLAPDGAWVNQRDLLAGLSTVGRGDGDARRRARELLQRQGRIEARIGPATGGRRSEEWRIAGGTDGP